MKPESSDPDQRTGSKVAVVGYGTLGRDHAIGLRRAGHDVRIGLRGGMSWVRAWQDGFRAEAPPRVVADAEVVAMLVPDDEQAAVWFHAIEPYAPASALVVLGRATPLATGAFEPRGRDVVLVTGAKGACRVALEHDASGRALERAVAYARAAYGPGAQVGTTSVAGAADAEIADLALRAGGMRALLADVERSIHRVSDSHAPDEAKIAFYEGLRELVARRVDESGTRVSDPFRVSGQGPRRGVG